MSSKTNCKRQTDGDTSMVAPLSQREWVQKCRATVQRLNITCTALGHSNASCGRSKIGMCSCQAQSNCAFDVSDDCIVCGVQLASPLPAERLVNIPKGLRHGNCVQRWVRRWSASLTQHSCRALRVMARKCCTLETGNLGVFDCGDVHKTKPV